MKKIILYLSVVFFLALSVGVDAINQKATYYFSRINGDLGLSHPNVKSIYQDHNGFIWLGTKNQLNRFDGVRMKVFDCYDKTKDYRNNNVSAIFEDESQIMWIGTDKGVFIFNQKTELFSFFDMITHEGISIADWVADIKGDNDGNIWILIPNQGVFRYSTKLQKLFLHSVGDISNPNIGGNPQSICIDNEGVVWIGSNASGIFRYDKNSNRFIQFLADSKGLSLRGQNIYTICDYGEDLLLGIHEGQLLRYNKRINHVSVVFSKDVHYKIIRDILVRMDEIWVATDNGIYVIDKDFNTIHICEDSFFENSLSNNIVEKLFEDKEGGIWAGTRNGGVSYMSMKSINFECYIPRENNPMCGRKIKFIKELNDEYLLVASEDIGLTILNTKNGDVRKVALKGGVNRNNASITSLLVSNDIAYIGYFKGGMDVVDLKTYKTKYYSGEALGLDEHSVYAICEDSNSNLWIGNGWGVFVGDKKTMKFQRMNQFGLNYVYDIIEDSKANIWVASMSGGVYKYNLKTLQISHFLHNSKDPNTISSNSVSDITETSDGNIWFSTDRGGICRYNSQTNTFNSYSIKDGLPDDITFKIIEDKNNNLWFGTNRGLVQFKQNDNVFNVFSKNKGLPLDEFSYKAAIATRDGKLYFGSMVGIVAFNPYTYFKNNYLPPVYITNIMVNNKAVDLEDKKSPLSKASQFTSKINLKYNQNNISIDYAALSYTAPKANKYAYMLEGIDHDWVYVTDLQRVTYAQLSPGSYLFKVKASNNDDAWNEQGASLLLEISNPWWSSTMAYLVYLILCFVIVYYVISWYLTREEEKQMEKRRIFESKREKELYNSKLEFFSNIAHEIRTPISLMSVALESLEEINVEDKKIVKNLSIVSKSNAELLQLIDQLLDFRKFDSSKFLLNKKRRHLSGFVKEQLLKYMPMSKKQNKTFEVIVGDEDIICDFDKVILSKIINNLMINAIRYSDTYIRVEVVAEQDIIKIIMQNDGDLIPEEYRNIIFDAFFQVEQSKMASSSGLGLSLVKSLAELHQIQVKYNVSNQLNEFVLEIDNSKVESKISEVVPDEQYIVDEQEVVDTKDSLISVLLVEDNTDMLDFIADKIKYYYKVEKVSNGLQALEIIKKKNIDIVVSDIMMPEMDGLELCTAIKEDIEFSHIPIVLLTAKTDLKSKIKGLEVGADAYIEKPFSINHLLTQISTILSNRQREKKAFVRKPFLPVKQIGINKTDEEFLEKLTSIIEKNMAESSFGVDNLSETVFMSRSNLHRKIKALTGLTSIDFIRLIKLKKAAEYIQTGKYRINEVCYMVGINSPSYFIKIFTAQFKMTPKEFAKLDHTQKN